MLHTTTKISVTSPAMNMARQRTVPMYTASCGLMTMPLLPDFERYYLRVGRLAIRMQVQSSHMEGSLMLHNMLICLCIFRRFINSTSSAKSTSSPSARLSGLCRYWDKHYQMFTSEQLLKELFGTLHLQGTMLYRLSLLLKVDFSRSVFDIVNSLILIELDYIQRLRDSLHSTFPNLKSQLIYVDGIPTETLVMLLNGSFPISSMN